jgi:hypothetical protein
MSFLENFGVIVGRALHQAAVAALLVPALVALRLVMLDMPLTERWGAMLAVLGAGAAVGVFAAGLVVAPLASRLSPIIRIAIMAPALVAGILAATAILYALIVRDFDPSVGSADLETNPIDKLLSHGSAAYLMVLGSWNIVFPWPIPLASLVLALLGQIENERSGAPAAAQDEQAESAEAAIPTDRFEAVLTRRTAT